MEDLIIVSKTELLDIVASIKEKKENSPSEIVWSKGRSSKKSTQTALYFGDPFSLLYKKQIFLLLM